MRGECTPLEEGNWVDGWGSSHYSASLHCYYLLRQGAARIHLTTVQTFQSSANGQAVLLCIGFQPNTTQLNVKQPGRFQMRKSCF